MKWMLVLIVLGVLAAGCGQSAAEKAAHGATDVCEQFVKDRLKSPSSAEFSDLDVRKADPYYIVEGSVDAMNPLGVKLRQAFSCTIEPKDKKASTWKLLGLNGLED